MNKSLKRFMSLSASALVLAGTALNAFAPAVAAEEAQDEDVAELEKKVDNEGEVIEGGTLRYALVSEGFAGLFNPLFYTTADDSEVMKFAFPSAISYDASMILTEDGIMTYDLDTESKVATFKLEEDTLWDDGEPLTIDDLIFSYYLLSDEDYDGSRLDQKVTNVVGYDEYAAGDADEISGLERIDDYTLEVTYKEVLPSYVQANAMFLTNLTPKHIFEDIPVSEMEDHDAVRKDIVGYGPFKFESITPGESVTFVANEHYWKGKPKVDKLVLEVVNPSVIVQELKAGNYDIADKIPEDQYDTWADAENFDVLGTTTNVYTYIGFNLGDWDEEAGESVAHDEEDAVVANKALRQAMAYAIDNDAVADRFYHGLRGRAKSFITPNFEAYYDDSHEGYPQDVEKAKQILEDAGFVDVDGDGFVEDPNGEPFTLNFASMSGGDIAQPLAEYYLNAWREIGIDVELYQGRLMELNAFYDELDKDNPDIHVFQAAIGVGGDPNPTSLWNRNSEWNKPRFVSEELDQLLEDINSEDTFDEEVRKEAYQAWNEYMLEELPQIPTLTRMTLVPVNKRVKHYTVDGNDDFGWEQIELTAEEPIQ